MKDNYEVILTKLASSKFRRSFHLKKQDKEYITKVGLSKIKDHAYDFITKRIAPANVANDGKQTPYHGHPVFIAEHATATCCRGCLYKWYHIPKDRELTKKEIDFIVLLIMTWINKEYYNK